MLGTPASDRRVQVLSSHLIPVAPELTEGLLRMDVSFDNTRSLWQDIPEVRHAVILITWRDVISLRAVSHLHSRCSLGRSRHIAKKLVLSQLSILKESELASVSTCAGLVAEEEV